MQTAIQERKKAAAPGKPTELNPRAIGQSDHIKVGTRVQLWNKTGQRCLFDGLVERISGERALIAASYANQIKRWVPLDELELPHPGARKPRRSGGLSPRHSFEAMAYFAGEKHAPGLGTQVFEALAGAGRSS